MTSETDQVSSDEEKVLAFAKKICTRFEEHLPPEAASEFRSQVRGIAEQDIAEYLKEILAEERKKAANPSHDV